ncbi:MAG: hypothetical protein HYT63_01650 [Candidatus Yanofskybacteria bacterium]|nr:hypothetical protein [Candidatus Yanofskybacteria bacterium]
MFSINPEDREKIGEAVYAIICRDSLVNSEEEVIKIVNKTIHTAIQRLLADELVEIKKGKLGFKRSFSTEKGGYTIREVSPYEIEDDASLAFLLPPEALAESRRQRAKAKEEDKKETREAIVKVIEEKQPISSKELYKATVEEFYKNDLGEEGFIDFNSILEEVKNQCWLMYEEGLLNLDESYKITLKSP